MRTSTKNRVGFFVQLPPATVKKIKHRATRDTPQWAVVRDAINATTPKSAGK